MASTCTTAVALRGGRTGGAISMIENTVPARWAGTPLHHPDAPARWWAMQPYPPTTVVGPPIGA